MVAVPVFGGSPKSEREINRHYRVNTVPFYERVPPHLWPIRTFVFGGQHEFVVRVIIVGIQLLIVVHDARSVHREMIVAHVVLDFGVLSRIGVHGFHFQNRRPERNVFVHVVRLVIGQFEFGSVVVDVGYANGKLRKTLFTPKRKPII